jgi:hypothetical protein
VRLARLKGKKSRVVARARTAKQGKARLGKQAPGRYRATVKPKVAPGLARCGKARSTVVRVRG